MFSWRLLGLSLIIGATLACPRSAGATTLFPRLYFLHGSTELLSDSSFYMQRDIAEGPDHAFKILVAMLIDNPSIVVSVRGHIDSTEQKFPGLALARSLLIRDRLESAGIACERLVVEVIGLSEPWTPNERMDPSVPAISMRTFLQEDRRVDFSVVAFDLPSAKGLFRWNERCCRTGAVNRELAFMWNVDWFGAPYTENKAAFDTVMQFIRAMPNVVIEVGSHTDTKPTKKFKGGNDELTQLRAQALVNVLIDEGVDPSRLSARGYGTTQPLISASDISGLSAAGQERAHQTNRRTEFKIIRCE